jgi:DNA topoisomerase-1
MVDKGKGTIMVVESPTKVKTLKKYFRDFAIFSTKGHFCNLKKERSAVGRSAATVDFTWKTNRTQIKDIINACKSGKYDRLVLATDRDREGSGIAFHLVNLLKKSKILPKKVQRIRFSSMTKLAVQEALDNPSEINLDLVGAYLARVAMDFVIGFGFSPALWVNLGPKLSSGRVQNPTLRILFDRYMERKHFKPEISFWLDLLLPLKNGDKIIATLPKQLLEKQLKDVQGSLSDTARVVEIKSKTVKISPKAPFITSSLQQAACSKLSKTVKQVMSLAQKLYEGVEIQGEQVPLITYMRTDSLYIHPDNLGKIREYISNNFPKDYLPQQPIKYLNKSKNTQEAHEAIRPTNINLVPESLKSALPRDQYELYKLIWERTVTSQMTQAERRTDSYFLENREIFKFNHSYLTFVGCLYFENKPLKPLNITKNHVFKNCSSEVRKHTTQPPHYHTEASLVKTLTQHGIGRPSTYGSIIEKIRGKNYVLNYRNLRISQLGIIMHIFNNLFLNELSEFAFTAKMEEDLDAIVNGTKKWEGVVFQTMDFVQSRLDNLAQLERNNIRKQINLRWNQEKFQHCEICKGELGIRSKSSVYLHCEKCKKNIPLDNKIVEKDGMIFRENSRYKQLRCGERVVYLPNNINEEIAFKYGEIFLQLPKKIKQGSQEYELCSGSRGFFKKAEQKNTSISLENLLTYFQQKIKTKI